MPYLNRDANGLVTGTANAAQDKWTNELVPDDHPDLLAYKARRQTAAALAAKRAAALAALDEQSLAKSMTDPTAPQAVKDYAAARRN